MPLNKEKFVQFAMKLFEEGIKVVKSIAIISFTEAVYGGGIQNR